MKNLLLFVLYLVEDVLCALGKLASHISFALVAGPVLLLFVVFYVIPVKLFDTTIGKLLYRGGDHS